MLKQDEHGYISSHTNNSMFNCHLVIFRVFVFIYTAMSCCLYWRLYMYTTLFVYEHGHKWVGSIIGIHNHLHLFTLYWSDYTCIYYTIVVHTVPRSNNISTRTRMKWFCINMSPEMYAIFYLIIYY